MITTTFEIISMLILMSTVVFLQIINVIITVFQYCFVHKKYENLQELFTKNSSYLDKLCV